jgi:RNA polymerase sigma-70 factor, ECF subfamily
MTQTSFVETVVQAQQGDREAFECIVAQWRRRALGVITRMVGRPDDAEDIAQDVFVRLYLSLDKLRDAAQFEAWMYRLIANAAIDYLRRHKRARIRVSDLSDEQVFTVEKTLAIDHARGREQQRDLRESVDRMLSLLSSEARTLLVLKEVEGLSIRELSEVFRISEDAVKVRLFRARQRILRAMSPKGDTASCGARLSVHGDFSPAF